MMLGTLGTQQQGLVYDDSLGIEVLKKAIIQCSYYYSELQQF